MKSLDAQELRSLFLDFFQQRGHVHLPSSSLLPENDPSILFTNAGMVQFKRIFQGEVSGKWKRAVTIQKCVRAGGKHNDLENVGFTARHHTFFEMLGNFSFGDYFKKDAIIFAWEFLTDTLELDASRLYPSVFEKDNEAFLLWKDTIGISPSRIYKMGEKDNFWSMGDTGPCGPCSEIYYDRGEEYGCHSPSCDVGCDCDRYLEVWNLVFMEFNRQEDGSLQELPKKSIDTGMGFERLLCILQDKASNYETDLFQPLIQSAAEMCGKAYGETHETDAALHVLADHARSSAFLLQEGLRPSNEGAGYVLRRIIRRALRFGGKLGFKEPFFWKVVEQANILCSLWYPELKEVREKSKEVIREEEERFQETLNRGLPYLYKRIQEQKQNPLTGRDVFILSDTFGVPVDVTDEILREQGIRYNKEEYDAEMEKQKKQSRGGTGGNPASGVPVLNRSLKESIKPTTFAGYEKGEVETSIAFVKSFSDGAATKLQVICPETVFYGESGGQVGDCGSLTVHGKSYTVLDTQKEDGYFIHLLEGKENEIRVGERCILKIDKEKRSAIARNHSATHLLQAALRERLGGHVKQAGSLVQAGLLRFDFTFERAVSAEELSDIEKRVNQQVLSDFPVITEELNADEAIAQGAMALFDEKYGDTVRVVTIGDYSKELCGGTHVSRSGEIGLFHIISESGVSAGVRRIEAITGTNLLARYREEEETIQQIRSSLKAGRGEELRKLKALLDAERNLRKEVEALKEKLLSGGGGSSETVIPFHGNKLIIREVEFAENDLLRKMIDELKVKHPQSISLVYYLQDGKIRLFCGVSDSLTGKFHAGKIIKEISSRLGGNGGGRADFAQGGGDNIQKLSPLLKELPSLLDTLFS